MSCQNMLLSENNSTVQLSTYFVILGKKNVFFLLFYVYNEDNILFSFIESLKKHLMKTHALVMILCF